MPADRGIMGLSQAQFKPDRQAILVGKRMYPGRQSAPRALMPSTIAVSTFWASATASMTRSQMSA